MARAWPGALHLPRDGHRGACRDCAEDRIGFELPDRIHGLADSVRLCGASLAEFLFVAFSREQDLDNPLADSTGHARRPELPDSGTGFLRSYFQGAAVSLSSCR